MSGLKEIKSRIVSVNSTMQITSAMKLVSAAKLKKAQDSITAKRPYAIKLRELLQNLSASLEGDVQGEYTDDRDVQTVTFVVITSNRGLCGGFNQNVVKKIRAVVESEYSDKNINLITIGKKGFDLLKNNFEVTANHSSLYDDVNFENVEEIAQSLMDAYRNLKTDKVVVVYNKFVNAAVQEVQVEQFLPVSIETGDSSESVQEYTYEPNKKELVSFLIPKTLKTQLYKGVLDSIASEHGARMTAMHQATDNADALKRELQLTYNKARQAAITKEILEIVSGAEALNG